MAADKYEWNAMVDNLGLFHTRRRAQRSEGQHER
jgi:hypothetical protein